MAIKQPLTGPVFVDMNTTKPSFLHLVSQTLVPAVGDAAFWTLTQFTIDGDGYLDAAAIASAGVASRYGPGVIAGHLYKVTIVVAATDDDIVVTMGSVTLGTMSSATTYTYYVRPADGNPLSFDWAPGTTLTASITSVVVEAQDPINPDLIPVA